MRLVREHLATCDACARGHRFERRLLEEIRGKLRRVGAPADVLARLRDTIRHAVRESER